LSSSLGNALCYAILRDQWKEEKFEANCERIKMLGKIKEVNNKRKTQ